MSGRYDVGAIEARWRRVWEAEGTYHTPALRDAAGAARKQYVLDFFPYPSGDGLSVGHARNYVPTDVLARYFRMRGDAVLHPMGWDAFGLPAENEALLRGRHPRETTATYAATYRRQLQLIGCSYDWSREFSTSDPEFSRWTQWGFLLLHRRGLAYRAAGWQWWCPRCRTILANEQVDRGRCWRHGDTPVQRRSLVQWYVRTTAYADRLLDDLEPLDWPEPIKAMQRNWIGRSIGVDVRLEVEGRAEPITVFTTRVDTLFGATFLALAPEHPEAARLAVPGRRGEVQRYIDAALQRSELDRQAQPAPTGVATGAVARHPLTGQALPVYVADYVLAHPGTGAAMGIPAHDARDWAFARAHGLPIRRVVTGGGGLPYGGEGILVDSPGFSGLPTDLARQRIALALAERRAGAPAVRYRLRDWLISRQRYWGAPIPIVYCPRCGAVPVPEADLPVRLPDLERYEPSGTGRSPLAGIPQFVRTACPRCGRDAERETDTLDGFADSSWYFLRFADPAYADGPWNPEAVRVWLPVDWYVGGAEHAVMHLLYARFFTKVLYDEGLVGFSEPFLRLRNQGNVLSPADGARMSKSRGNVVTPDEVVARYGADALRVAVLFLGPFHQDVTWDPRAVAGAWRFVRRLYRLLIFARPAGTRGHGAAASPPSPPPAPDQAATREAQRALHRLIRAAAEAIERFRFNTLVADLMAFVRQAERWAPRLAGTALWDEVLDALVRVCAPVVPFLAEEVWHAWGRPGSVHLAPWPASDPALARAPATVVAVQVDGRTRDRIAVAEDLDREEVIALARARPRVAAAVGGREVAGVVVVPGRVVNFVTRPAAPRQGAGPQA